MKNNITKRHDRQSVASLIKDLRTYAGMLEAYFKCTQRQHRRLDPAQVCRYAESAEIFAGKLMDKVGRIDRNRFYPAARVPVKYLNAVQNNPDGTLTEEELKIRYMSMGRCGR
jgi:hypothetical protein